jgi:hypothetical protein
LVPPNAFLTLPYYQLLDFDDEKPYNPQPIPAVTTMHVPTPTTPEKASSSSMISPDAVLQKLCSIEGSYYLGDDNLASKCKFLIGSIKEGNTLIVNTKDCEPTEFLLCGAFDIDKQDFYFVADGNYFPNKNFGSKFCNVKVSCRLTPICPDPSFKFLTDHYSTAVTNIHAIEKIAPCAKHDTITSILYSMSEMGSTAINSIKLTHNLFSKVSRLRSSSSSPY